ncbi:MAG TPA: flagellar biosynthetic protein FliO [Devosiaceae bacterium]|jgi:flagellar biogenesis protein FliO
MQFLTGLLGGSGNAIITVALALGIVLVLIVLVLWLLKLVFKASTNAGRARNRRLAVVDTMMLDPKRQLLIIRRDDVEHLIITGGPQDVVVETGIPVEVHPMRLPMRRPAQAPAVPPQRAANSVLPPGARPEAATAQAQPQALSPQTPVERLRDLGRPAGERRSTSLRHTGLMRPVSRVEPALIPVNPENPGNTFPDSARTGREDGSDGRTGDGQTGDKNQLGKHGAGRKADGT